MTRMMFVVMLVCVLPKLGVAQERGKAQAAYLQLTGLEEDAQELENALFERLSAQKPFMLEEHRQGIARFFAFVMSVSGLDAEKTAHLESNGIDLVRAITGNTRPLNEQALMADLVLVGEVVGFTETPDPGDGFRSSITVAVEEVLTGTAPVDTLVIRQRSGVERAESDERAARDLFPSIGDRYLLLLSNGMYRFYVASRGEAFDPVPESEQARHYSIYRYYPMNGSRLLWNGYSRGDTRRAFRALRKLNTLRAQFE